MSESVTRSDPGETRSLLAYCLPFAVFMAGLAAVQGVQSLAGASGPEWMREPVYWIYPIQSILCAGALLWAWRFIDFGPQRGMVLAVAVGLGVFALWVSPQALFGMPPRVDGFDPTRFAEGSELYWGTVAARFFRLVIIVPLIEEIFWRGFLMRYLIDERFTKVPFGQYRALSFWGVTLLFALAHWGPDFVPALLTGAIFGWVTVKTKSLTAVVVCHAVTNLALGIYIMKTGQWGFW